ncbi:pentatricopeptide repeat-containing protein At4g14190, chloroplastic-like [Zingiber officinale]|uniref:Pentatricopeptide repeat-containing protein n=1 Tax=Zingiber officinale TaxID=94328 RepID=A0A8J5GW24_ZINOF|nr:pentatricopeptide repeat-containing protein At4g14190, chloroplastic-like [Zingiber officinale]KAG6510504.1 hypothetical protein ZIOFF_028528 [Zingiber officinale]
MSTNLGSASFYSLSSFRNYSFSSSPSSTISLPILNSQHSSSSKLRSSRRPVAEHQPLPQDWEQRHRTLLVDTFHRNNGLRSLIHEASINSGSSALQLLEKDGDWTEDNLWAMVSFLVETGRAEEALQVFDLWKNIEMTRNNPSNHLRIIKLFCGEGFMIEAMSAFEATKKSDIIPSLAIYNTIIHAFARKRDFHNSNATFAMMLEAGLLPTPETYNGLIRAYGCFGLYDEMSKCVKRMELSGCFPDEVTYNILITEYARSGLLEKMESTYRVLSSKNLNLQASTLVSMLEAYAEMGNLEKIERVYRRILKLKAYIKENLIRKLALVYIRNYRFAQLEELGNDVRTANWGKIDLVWYILLLSSAGLVSKKGVESILHEMEEEKVPININIVNILAHFYLKIRDFRSLNGAFRQARVCNIKPDLITYGIFFDACDIGYDGIHVLEEWRRSRYLEDVVGIRTDQLVLSAFGKGSFLKLCEKKYITVHSRQKQKKIWRYSDVIRLVLG